MTSTLPPNSSNWNQVGDAFYRKEEIYRMSWSVVDLSVYRVVGAPFAGPLAITFDKSKPIPILDPTSSLPSTTRPRIHVYSCSGELIHTVIWDHSSSLVSFGFTNAESLVTVSSNGFYRLYPLCFNPSGPADLLPYTQHTLGQTTEELGVLDAIIWADGMVVMRSDLTFVQIKGWPEPPLSEFHDPSSDNPNKPTIDDGSVVPNLNQMDMFSSFQPHETRPIFHPDPGNGQRESLESGGLTQRPTTWAVIPPHSSSTGVIQLLVSRQDSILVIDPMDSTDQRLAAKGPFFRIVPSPNGKFLALLTGPTSPKPYTVWVVSSDFSRELSEFSLVEQTGQEFMNDGQPTQMVWCGEDTVVIAWEKNLLMIGPFGASLRYTFTEAIHLVTEIDGIRIVSSTTCEFLSKVASCTSMVFTPGSASPAAILFDALDHFDKHSARVADEHIRNIRKKLIEAVNVCIQAAGKEFEPRWQQRLMKAAGFGKIFLDAYNPEPFVNMSKILRVLNAVRDYKIGIPLTYEQYISHPLDHLISRLTARSHYLLALRLTEFLNLSPAAVLRHWARSLMLTNSTSTTAAKETASPEMICERIVLKLKGRHGVSPADIAEIAWSLGKTKLCTELLAHESRPNKQIPLLMSMDQGKEALQQSIKSLDPDLIQTVLWEIRARRPLAEFLTMVEGKDDAISTLRTWAKASVERPFLNEKEPASQFIKVGSDWELYRDFCYQDDRRTESGCLCLEESYLTYCPTKNYSSAMIAEWEAFFTAKITKIKGAINFFSEDSERVFEQGMMTESVKLLTFQKTLIMDILNSWESGAAPNNQGRDQLKKNFLDAMVSNKGLTMPGLIETIRQCVKLGLRKQADKLKVDFKVPEKRFWYVKMKALIELKDWDGLESWSGKKSPIGFEPFVHQLLAMGCHREALRYIPKCEARNRVELYVKCGEWVTAGEECADRGETAKLIELRQRCPSPHVASALSKMIEDLAA